MLTLSANFVISSSAAANQVTAFEITDIKLYVLVAKLLQQLKSCFNNNNCLK